VTGDGAGVSYAKTGVRVASFPGSTESLNQSSNDVCNRLFYTEEKRAESWDVLEKRLRGLHPDLARLYRDGELRPGGVRSGFFVKLVLVADKPFLRHVLGIASHNHNCFGPPFRDRTDVDIKGPMDDGLYNFRHDMIAHYGGYITPEVLCARAHVHVPLWRVLGEPEPDTWSFTCDCCNEVCIHSYIYRLARPHRQSHPRHTTHSSSPAGTYMHAHGTASRAVRPLSPSAHVAAQDEEGERGPRCTHCL
jgi:hypothetical protein